MGRPMGRPPRKRETVDRILREKGFGGLVPTLDRIDWQVTTYQEAAAIITGLTSQPVHRTTIPIWRVWADTQQKGGVAA